MSFSFGSAPASTGFGFGSQPAAGSTGTGMFGSAAAAPAATGFGFGAAQPSAGSGGTGMFGSAPASAAPASSGFGFGSTQPAATSGGLGMFGSAGAAPASGFGFGATPAASTGGSGLFGAAASTAPTSTGFGFGSTQPAAASGGLFGSSTAAAPSSSGFGFGAAPATSGFGATPATGGFGSTTTTGGFGSTPATSAFGAPAAGGGLFGSASSTAAPSSTGFSFGATQPASTGTGMFGTTTAAPATSGFSFGATPAAGSSTGGGMFGSTSATPSTGGFGGFGTAPAASSTGGLGMFGSSNTSGTGGFGFGATSTGTKSLFGSTPGGGAFGATTLQPQAQAVNPLMPQEPVTFDTQYKDLEKLPNAQPYKAEIDRTYSEFKQPMKLKLSEIAATKGSTFSALNEELEKVQLFILKIESKQIALYNEIKPFLEEIKNITKFTRIQGLNGLAQIRRRVAAEKTGGPILLLDEHLPNQFYVSIADKLETRLVSCMEGIKYFSAQLKTRLAAIEQSRRDGTNGQAKIGPKQVLELIKYQNDAFMKIASSIAAVHREVDEVKAVFLKVITKMDKAKVNPFEAADRKEQAEKRLIDQKMKMETMKHQQGSVFGNVTNGQPIGSNALTATATPSLGGFGSPAPTTSGFGAPSSGFGFGTTPGTTTGGFGATTSTPGPSVSFSLGGTTATPGASTSGFGFGTPAASSTGNMFGIPPISTGATPTAGGFGAPATPGPSFGSIGAKSSLGALDLATRSSPAAGKSLFGAPLAAGGFDPFKQPMALPSNPFENPDPSGLGRAGTLTGKPKKKK